jgi:hypothetical protein
MVWRKVRDLQREGLNFKIRQMSSDVVDETSGAVTLSRESNSDIFRFALTYLCTGLRGDLAVSRCACFQRKRARY